MRHIHACRIIHCDLKPANILINENHFVWICDFGASRPEDGHTDVPECGTPRYAAPEQYEPNGACTPKSDVFAFGLLLYEMLVGAPVFPPSEDMRAVIGKLRNWTPPSLRGKHGELMQRLLDRCCEKDPTDRPSFQDIFRTLKDSNFEILPDVDRDAIRVFADKIVASERKS
jgi:serine/threonine protein kinase